MHPLSPLYPHPQNQLIQQDWQVGGFGGTGIFGFSTFMSGTDYLGVGTLMSGIGGTGIGGILIDGIPILIPGKPGISGTGG